LKLGPYPTKSKHSDRVMIGAALSREFIAHECAPTEISNMSG